MSSISEQIAQDQMASAKKAAGKLVRPMRKGTVKGICLIVKASELTAKTLMAAVKQCLYEKTGDISYSNRNISMKALKKSGKVSIMPEGVTQDVMQYFDKYCKKYGIKYSAMLDQQNPKASQYMVFFQSDNADLIMKALQEGYKDFSKAAIKGKTQGKEAKSNEKESVIGKLYSFRDRLKHNEMTNSKEKVKNHDDLAR